MLSASLRKFRDISIRSKTVLVTLVVCVVALLSTAGGLYVFQIAHFRQTFGCELRTLSHYIAESSTTALETGDAAAAGELLALLRLRPEIVHAAIFRAEGGKFAAFGPEGDAAPPADAPRAFLDDGDAWTIIEPVMRDGLRLGTFRMHADFASPRGEVQRLFFNVTAAVLVGTLLLVILLASQLQKVISRPVRELAAASESVARNHDYSVRVQRHGADEVGVLTDAFNQMLAQIQTQDAALQSAREQLSRQLQSLRRGELERKRAENAQAMLTAIIEATPDFVANADVLGRVLYLNPAARRMTGLDPDSDVRAMRLSELQPGWAARLVSTEGIPGAIHDGVWSAETAVLHRDGREIHVSQVIIAHRNPEGGVARLSTVMRDISERRAAEEALGASQKKLLQTSRLAGMAEVATGVLHNVGNVLNSVNVSAGVVLGKLRASRAAKVVQAAELLVSRNGSLAEYLTTDAAGRKLPGYLAKLGAHLVEENAVLISEAEQLTRNIEHIKEVVAMQQSYAKVSGVFEDLALDRLVEDALAMNAGAFERHAVAVERRFAPAPLVRVDRHRVLQILINLLRNAKYAIDDASGNDRRIIITIGGGDSEAFVSIADTGVGIPEENLTRIFSHGFTTRKQGHGFGLHSGALAAREMGGALRVHSDGPGKGAIFTLTLRVAPVACAA